MEDEAVQRQAEISLGRILPRLEERFAGADRVQWNAFRTRLERHFPRLFALLVRLYGGQYDFFYHLESIVATCARMWLDRPADLKALDAERETAPRWFQSQKMVGGVCYVDLFAGNLKGLRARIPYLKELGLTYLHLMPLFLAPEGENDGGYAVSSYRQVNPALGTMEELASLARELRKSGISLVLDFVFNHTSDEHEWAKAALKGDPDYMNYYYMFPDRTMPDRYERTLREIFPDARPGSFTYRADVGQWVWTTFNSFQWDLNYSNPAVFEAMAEEMLFLANHGAEVLRLDALAFIWKQIGTPCESLPEAHLVVQAYNAVARIAAPSLLFKSEAILHPDEVAKYIDEDECQLSYNPLLMALEWETLATREVRLLELSMRERFKIGQCCAWVNYVRSHDDIGWTFDDTAAANLGINGFDHRRFLNSFYTGRFEGSFARGLPFQENPRTGDARISGTAASLGGLETAITSADPNMVDIAVRRILLMYSIALSIGGIPLIYLGDELGTLNDYSYRADPAKLGDSRWVHRPRFSSESAERRHAPETVEGRIFQGLLGLIKTRRECEAFAGNNTDFVPTANPHVFGYVRRHGGARVLVLANFSEEEQVIAANELRVYGLGYAFRDLVTGLELSPQADVALDAYRFAWLVPV